MSVVGGVVGVAAGAPWPFADTVGGVDGASGAFRFGGVRGGVEGMALGTACCGCPWYAIQSLYK